MFGAFVQTPDEAGCVHDHSDFVARAKQAGVLVAVATDLLALTRILYHETNSVGPVSTFIGIAGADGTAATPVTDVPVPLFQAVSGLGFHLVIEAVPGPSGLPIGQRLLNSNPNDPTLMPRALEPPPVGKAIPAQV